MCDGEWCDANCWTFIWNVCVCCCSVDSTHTLNTHVSHFRFHMTVYVHACVRACLQVSDVNVLSLRSCAYWWCSFNQTVNSTDGVDLKLHSKTYTSLICKCIGGGAGGRLFVFSFSFYSIFSTRFFYICHLVHDNHFIRNSNSIVSMPFFSFISNANFIVRRWVFVPFCQYIGINATSWHDTRIQ